GRLPPFRRPAAAASRTAFSMASWECTPTVFRNFRMLMLRTSSSMCVSLCFVASGATCFEYHHSSIDEWAALTWQFPPEHHSDCGEIHEELADQDCPGRRARRRCCQRLGGRYRRHDRERG